MPTEWTFNGWDGGERYAVTWRNDAARYLALLAHGYGEHIRRYDWVAEQLVAHGAAVAGVDHVGHGRSAGERVSLPEPERMVDDFHTFDLRVREGYPDLPVVLIGHSMGGMVATRYAQRYGDTLAALVLSGPVVGTWPVLPHLLSLPEIPDDPIDVSTLSRDDAVGAAYAEDPLIWHGPFKRETLEGLSAELDVIAGDRLGDVPTVWLHGEDDQLVPIEASRAGIGAVRGPAFESKSYPGARHEIFNETNRADVLADVTAFLDRSLT